MAADYDGWARSHASPDDDFEEALADAPLYIDDRNTCMCCGVEYCTHEHVTWTSGTPGVFIPLNGDVAATCDDCGLTATMDEMEEAADGLPL